MEHVTCHGACKKEYLLIHHDLVNIKSYHTYLTVCDELLFIFIDNTSKIFPLKNIN